MNGLGITEISADECEEECRTFPPDIFPAGQTFTENWHKPAFPTLTDHDMES